MSDRCDGLHGSANCGPGTGSRPLRTEKQRRRRRPNIEQRRSAVDSAATRRHQEGA